MMDVHLNKMCRICLKEGDDLKSIFYNDELPVNQISVPNKIMACSSVQVVAGDGLPELICVECLKQVDIAYEFKEKCQSADATLRKYISLVQPFFSCHETTNQVPQQQHEEPQTFTEENMDAKYDVGLTFKENKEEMLNSVKGKKGNLGLNEAEESATFITSQKKKKQDKTEVAGCKKPRGSKKGSEEGGSDNDKKKRTKDEKDVKCPICQKKFAYLCILKDHMVQHTGAKPYLCSACGKAFGHITSLTNHMKTHYSDKPHKCDRCELSFHRRAHLVLHIRTHTGEKPFVCDVCGRDFAQSSYLKEHMRVHSGEKPFVCDICGHGFARKSGLVMHRRVHTGELPYACPECGRGFSQRSQRKRHVKRNHKGSPCLRATGELILKDLDLKNKNSKREEILSDNTLNDNAINNAVNNSMGENSLNLPQDNTMLQRGITVPMQPYQPAPSGSNPPLINYLSTGQYFDFVPYNSNAPGTYPNPDSVTAVR